MDTSPKMIDQLRREVWTKAVGTPEIVHATHYYEQIGRRIREQTGYRLHRDTIRNFFQGKHDPQPRILDIYSTYVLDGTETAPRTFLEFVHTRENREAKTAEAEQPPKDDHRETPRRRVAFLFFLSLLVAVGTAGFYRFYWHSGKEITDLSVAVLPLKATGNPEEYQYFADGMTEAILNNLAGIDKNLVVVSRTSVEQYKDSPRNIPEIARALNVGYVLEGSVTLEDKNIRVRVQLIDGKTDRQRWAGDYLEELRDVFSLQDRIARAIAQSLQVDVLPEVNQRLQAPPTRNLDAYDLYLRGQQRFFEASSSGGERQQSLFEEAADYFRQALSVDSSFALPFAGLAKVYFALRSGQALTESLDSIRWFCDRALALDPNLPDAYVERAFYYDNTFQEKKAKADLLRALTLNPNHPEANLRMAGYYFYREGDYPRTFELLNKVLLIEHSPESLQRVYDRISSMFLQICDFEKSAEYARRRMNLLPPAQQSRAWEVWQLMVTGRFPEALELGKTEFKESDPAHLRSLGELHLQAGDYARAVDYLRREKAFIEQSGYRDIEEILFFYGRLGQALYLNGRQKEGVDMIRKSISNILEVNKKYNSTIPYYDLAGCYAFLGDTTNAYRYLRAETFWRNGAPHFLEHDIQFARLRGDPEFQAIVRRVQADKRAIREEVRRMSRELSWVL